MDHFEHDAGKSDELGDQSVPCKGLEQCTPSFQNLHPWETKYYTEAVDVKPVCEKFSISERTNARSSNCS